MGVFYIGDREWRGGVFRRLCVGILSPFLSLIDIFLVNLKFCHICFYMRGMQYKIALNITIWT